MQTAGERLTITRNGVTRGSLRGTTRSGRPHPSGAARLRVYAERSWGAMDTKAVEEARKLAGVRRPLNLCLILGQRRTGVPAPKQGVNGRAR